MNKEYIIISLVALICLNGLSQNIPYNKNYQLACHNCYEPQYENICDLFSYTSVIEIDIWDNFRGTGLFHTGKKMNADWYVKHKLTGRGNVNCCGGTFHDCLTTIKKWSNEHPNHDVITVFIDKKENWSNPLESRKPGDFDQLLKSVFGEENIITPSNLLKDNANLKEAMLNNLWQPLDSLKGKIIFVITDATGFSCRNPLNEYMSAQKNEPVCFVAPRISNENEIQHPKKFSPDNVQDILFYNLKYESSYLAPSINSINCLSRVYGTPETNDSYLELLRNKVNFIAVDNYRLAR